MHLHLRSQFSNLGSIYQNMGIKPKNYLHVSTTLIQAYDLQHCSWDCVRSLMHVVVWFIYTLLCNNVHWTLFSGSQLLMISTNDLIQVRVIRKMIYKYLQAHLGQFCNSLHSSPVWEIITSAMFSAWPFVWSNSKQQIEIERDMIVLSHRNREKNY